MLTPEPLKNITEQREWYARRDGELSVFAALSSTYPPHGALQMLETQRSFLEKPLPSRCRPDPCVTSLEEVRSDPMLQIAHAPAYR